MRITNTYYSNLIEGHNTRPRDIQRALDGDLDQEEGRRNLQLEAAAHVRVQAEIDRMAAAGTLPTSVSRIYLLAASRILSRCSCSALAHPHPGSRVPDAAGHLPLATRA